MRRFMAVGTFCMAMAFAVVCMAQDAHELKNPATANVQPTIVPQGYALVPVATAPVVAGNGVLNAPVTGVATSVPPATPAVQASVPSGFSEFMDKVPWGSIGTMLGLLLLGVFSVLGQKAAKVRAITQDVIYAAWYIAERNGGDGAKKYTEALKNLYEGLSGQGIPVTSQVRTLADIAWKGMSAKDGIPRDARLAEFQAVMQQQQEMKQKDPTNPPAQG